MILGSIASGSSGNCLYVGNEKDHYLIDAGISRKKIIEGLHEMKVDPASIKAVFLTHEHNDHIAGLGVFLRKYHVPVFGTGGTIDAVLSCQKLGKIDRSLFEVIHKDKPVKIGSVRVEASGILHDAADPVSYTFEDETSKVGAVTDVGTFDDYLVEKYQNCETLLVEANHDLNMLMAGPYPYPLKRRIMGNLGHLSNERAGQFLSKVLGTETKQVLLGHLSKENNYKELAYEAVKTELVMHNIDPDDRQIELKVADRYTPTFTFTTRREEH